MYYIVSYRIKSGKIFEEKTQFPWMHVWAGIDQFREIYGLTIKQA